jgi:hypothetical protein
MPLISITRQRVRSWRFLPPFFVYALRSARETVAAEGNLTSVAHWTQASSDLRSWADAHRRIQQDGRPSKVDHPSPEQIAYRIATLTADERRERVYR